MSDQRIQSTFEGFLPPVDDYFRMPNAWINICAKIDSLAELKIVQYVLRHTWGYQEFSGARKITIDEFMHGRKRKDGSRIDDGTGLSKQSVITAVEAAITHGYLICDKDTKDLARQKKYYQLAMKSDVKRLDSSSDVKGLDISGVKNLDTQQLGVKNLDISDVKDLDLDVKGLDSDGQEFRHRSEKDTIERHYRKTLEERQDSSAALADATHSPSNAKAESSEDAQPLLPTTPNEPVTAGDSVPQVSRSSSTSNSQLWDNPTANHSTMPTSTQKTTGRAKNKKADEEKPTGPPVMPAPDAEWCTRTCLQMFDAWRGAPLLDLSQIKYANSCAKRLAENYSREQVCIVRESMNMQDFWIEHGGADVCDVARHMQKELNKLKSKSNGHNGKKPAPIDDLPLYQAEVKR